MSILKKLLHKCSYQLGGNKVNKVNTTSIPIKNNNSLKPATQYKRVNKKDKKEGNTERYKLL